MFKAKHYKKKGKKNNFGTCMYNHNLIRLFLLNRIWISKTEIIINRKLKKKRKICTTA